VLPGVTIMRATLAQYTNDIVSLTVMALMSIALVAGQVGAAEHIASEPTGSDILHVLQIDIDLSFRQEGE
jgi:hypothetical protein